MQSDCVLLRGDEDTERHQRSTRTEGQLCEGAAHARPPAGQGERPQRRPTCRGLHLGLAVSRAVRKHSLVV